MQQILVLLTSFLTVAAIPERTGPFERSSGEQMRRDFTRTLLDEAATIADHPAFPHMAEIARLGGWGMLEKERAAFLTVDGKGVLRCVLWPASVARRESQFRGAMPANTVAIIHTHPRNTPNPSHHDFAESERLGVPIFVVTPKNLTGTGVDGELVEVVRRSSWLDSGSDTNLCQTV